MIYRITSEDYDNLMKEITQFPEAVVKTSGRVLGRNAYGCVGRCFHDFKIRLGLIIFLVVETSVPYNRKGGFSPYDH